jgi:hypothetical protein
MRRRYVSPEFEQSRVFGTFNMVESSTLFASKMLEIEDEINLNEQSVIYYQNSQSEQIDISVETSTDPITYRLVDDKFVNSELIIDPSQNDFQRNTKTKWILTINLKTLLSNYIFAVLKENRTFEGIKNSMTSRNSVDTAMREYILKNVLNRYKLESVSLYLKYNDLRRQNALRYKNNWSTNTTQISNSSYKNSKIETQTAFDFTSIKVLFSQERNSDLFNFDYYYTIFWKKL